MNQKGLSSIFGPSPSAQNLEKPTKSNRFAPFVVNRITSFARHFFQQNLMRTLKWVWHGTSIGEIGIWILRKPQRATVLILLWFTEERHLHAISFNRICDDIQINCAWSLRLEKLDVASWQTHKKQRFCAFCGLPKNAFCTPFPSAESIDASQIN